MRDEAGYRAASVLGLQSLAFVSYETTPIFQAIHSILNIASAFTQEHGTIDVYWLSIARRMGLENPTEGTAAQQAKP